MCSVAYETHKALVQSQHRDRSWQLTPLILVELRLLNLFSDVRFILFCQFNKKGSKFGDVGKKSKSQMWNSVVTVVLVEGKNLLPMDDNGLSDPYVKFRLGNEKYKSKVCWQCMFNISNSSLFLYHWNNQVVVRVQI